MRCQKPDSQESKKGIKNVCLKQKDWGATGSLEPFDMELYANEVVGIAGLLGSGRTELANLTFGIDTPDTGTLTLNEQEDQSFFAFGIAQKWNCLVP